MASWHDQAFPGSDLEGATPGLTVYQYAVLKAMQGLCSNPHIPPYDVANKAVAVARQTLQAMDFAAQYEPIPPLPPIPPASYQPPEED